MYVEKQSIQWQLAKHQLEQKLHIDTGAVLNLGSHAGSSGINSVISQLPAYHFPHRKCGDALYLAIVTCLRWPNITSTDVGAPTSTPTLALQLLQTLTAFMNLAGAKAVLGGGWDELGGLVGMPAQGGEGIRMWPVGHIQYSVPRPQGHDSSHAAFSALLLLLSRTLCACYLASVIQRNPMARLELPLG